MLNTYKDNKNRRLSFTVQENVRMSVGFLFTQKGVAMEKVLRRLVMKELTNEYNK